MDKHSSETQNEALTFAKGRQKKGQTKEQTKLIAQGIEKGISDYKKQQKAKARERDKLRKKQKNKTNDAPIIENTSADTSTPESSSKILTFLPWLLLLLSWVYFLTS